MNEVALPPSRRAGDGRAERAIVLAMHGAPPLDFPARELDELMSLHSRPDHGGPRGHDLEARVRGWPRGPENDPYWSGSRQLADALEREMGCPVVVGYNEFCDPTVEQAIAHAATLAPAEILVMTPMLTRGGVHSERDIPAAVAHAREAHPGIRITYVWPVGAGAVARFLAQLAHLWSEVA